MGEQKRKSSRCVHAHPTRIMLTLSSSRAFIRLRNVVRRQKADIPDMLTPWAWIPDATEWGDCEA
jgi:hypothetical protein